MPEEKVTYQVGEDKYDIDPSESQAFLKDFPDAVQLKSFVVGKDTFDIHPEEEADFLKDFPDAKPTFGGLGKPAPVPSGASNSGTGENLQGSGPSTSPTPPVKGDKSMWAKKVPANFDLKQARRFAAELGYSDTDLPTEDLQVLVENSKGKSIAEAAALAKEVIETNRANAPVEQKTPTRKAVESTIPSPVKFPQQGENVGFGVESITEKIGLPTTGGVFQDYETKQAYNTKFQESYQKAIVEGDKDFNESLKILDPELYQAVNSGPELREKVESEANIALAKFQKVLDAKVDEAMSGAGWKDFIDHGTASEAKLDEYAKKMAAENGVADDGFAKNYIKGQLRSRAQMMRLKPRVDAEFEVEKERILKRAGEEVSKSFTSAEETKAEATLRINSLKDEIAELQQFDMVELEKRYSPEIKTIQDSWAATEMNAKMAAEQIQQAVASQQMDPNEAQMQLQQLNQQYEEQHSQYVKTITEVNNSFMSELNASNTRYQQRFQRQQEEIATQANKKIEKDFADWKASSNIDDKTAAALQRTYSNLFNKVQKEDLEGRARAENIALDALDKALPIPNAAAFVLSTGSSLGSSISAIGASMKIDGMETFGKIMQQKYELTPARTESFSDLMDIRNLSKLSGQLMGSMLPGVVATAVAARTGQGGGVATEMIMGGLAGWYAETLDITGRMYQETLEKTGDLDKATKAADELFGTQIALMPLYAFEALPFVSKAVNIGGKSTIGRALVKGGIEVGTEFSQELPQGIFEEAVSLGKDPYEYFGKFASDVAKQDEGALQKLKSTFISIAPTFILGAAGEARSSVSESSRKQDEQRAIKGKVSDVAAALAAKDSFMSSTPELMGQQMFRLTSLKGKSFATAVVSSLFTGGQIDEATRDSLLSGVEKAQTYTENAQKMKMSEGEAITYVALSEHYEAAQAQADQESDPIIKAALEKKASRYKTALTDFVDSRKGDFVSVQFADGTEVIVSSEDILDKARTDLQFREDFNAGHISMKFFGDENSSIHKEVAEILTAKQEEPGAKKDSEAAQKPTKTLDDDIEVGDTVDLTPKAEAKVEQVTAPASDALKDVESTAKEFDKLEQEKSKEFSDVERMIIDAGLIGAAYSNHTLSEAYHKAKSDGSNPELVNAVEELLSPKTNSQSNTQNNGSKQSSTEESKQEKPAQSSEGESSNESKGEPRTESGGEVRSEDVTQGNEGNRSEGENDVTQEVLNPPNEQTQQTTTSEGQQTASVESGQQQLVDESVQEPAKPSSGDSVIDFLDSLKRKPGTNVNSSPIPIAIFFWNGFIESVKIGYKTGKTFAAGVAKGIEYLESIGFSKDEIDEYVAQFSGMTSGTDGFNLDEERSDTSPAYKGAAQMLEEMGYPNLAQQVLANGTFQRKSQDTTNKDAKQIISILGMDEAVKIAKTDATIAADVRSAILLEKVKADKNEGTLRDLANSFDDLVKFTKDSARVVSYMNTLYEAYPELRIEKDLAIAGVSAKEAMGDENNSFSPMSKAKRAMRRIPFIKRDVFSAIGAALGGLIDSQLLFDPSSQFYLTDNKMRNLMKTLVEFGGSLDANSRGVLARAMRDSLNKATRATTREQIKQIIDGNLNDFNGRIPVPMDAAQLAELSNAMMSLYDLQSNSYIIKNSRPDAPIKLNKDTFSAIANALGGLINIEEIFNEKSKNYVSDAKLRALLKKLSEFGSSRKEGDLTILSQAIKDSLQKSNRATSRQQISDLIQGGLNDFNGRVRVPMTPEQIEELHKTLMSLYDIDSNSYIIANSKAVKPARLKKDIFNTLAHVLEGNLDAAFLYNYGFDPFSKQSAAQMFDGKMQRAVKTLLSFGQMFSLDEKASSVFSQMMANIAENGTFAMAENSEAAKEIIIQNINDMNGRLQAPMSEKNKAELADAMLTVFEEMSQRRIGELIDQVFNGKKLSLQGAINRRIAKALLYGIFDNQRTAELFAQKYGIPTFTPQQVQNLKTLSLQINQAKGKFAQQVAQTRYNNALKAATSSAVQRIFNRVTFHIPAMIYNTLLSTLSTMSNVANGNILRIIPLVIANIRSGAIYSLKDVYKSREYTLPDGSIVKINHFKDGIYSAYRGNPSLIDAKSSGLSATEQRIRNSENVVIRRLMRTFEAPAGRLMTGLDAATAPFIINLTKRQLMTAMINQAYRETNAVRASQNLPPINLTKQQIADEVSYLIGNDQQVYTDAITQAMSEVKASPLWSDLGFTPADAFPADVRLQRGQSTSREGKVYAEMINRANEIVQEGEPRRLQYVKDRMGLSDFGDLNDLAEEIDRYAARRTRELTLMGTPRGIEGEMATVINKFINTKMGSIGKYAGVLPMFNNALWNVIAFGNRIAPGINIIQYAAYRIAKERGFGLAKENLSDFSKKYDQNEMLHTVIATNLATVAAVAAIAAFKGDDRDKEIQSILDGKYSGFTPAQFTPAQRRLFTTTDGVLLLPGQLYINGEPVFNYGNSPFAGLINSIAYFGDKASTNLWNWNPNKDLFGGKGEYTEPFLEDEEDFGDVMSGYLYAHATMLANTSQIKNMTEFVGELVNPQNFTLTQESDINAFAQRMNTIEKKSAKTIKSLIPYSRLQAEGKNYYDAFTGQYEKKPTSFVEELSFGMWWEDEMLKNNNTDGFGRPIPERANIILPFLGINPVSIENGKVGSPVFDAVNGGGDAVQDPWIKLKVNQRYVDSQLNSNSVTVSLDIEDMGYSEAQADQLVKDIRAGNIEGVGIAKGMNSVQTDISQGKFHTKSILTTVAIDRKASADINQRSGEFVLKVLQANSQKYSTLENMPREEFIKMMADLYKIGRNIGVAQYAPDAIKDMRSQWFDNIEASMSKWNEKYNGLSFKIPDNLIPLDN
jgi:hypothetical protein